MSQVICNKAVGCGYKDCTHKKLHDKERACEAVCPSLKAGEEPQTCRPLVHAKPGQVFIKIWWLDKDKKEQTVSGWGLDFEEALFLALSTRRAFMGEPH